MATKTKTTKTAEATEKTVRKLWSGGARREAVAAAKGLPETAIQSLRDDLGDEFTTLYASA